MTISIGSDHGGFLLKNKLVDYLKNKSIDVIDNGTFSLDSCDYPDFAKKVALDVQTKRAEFGIVVCTTGQGVAITVNRFKGVRCAIAYNDEATKLARQHNDANVISFSEKFMSEEEVIRRLEIFLNTQFEGGRHLRRVEKIDK